MIETRNSQAAYQPTLQSPKRWAVNDIAYVRENYAQTPVRQIAQDLNEPLGRVQNLVGRLKKSEGKVSGTGSQTGDAVQIVPQGGTSAAKGAGGTCTSPAPLGVPEAPFFQPADLAGFVRGVSLRELAVALKVSRTTAHRLKAGYWPSDERAILRAWDAYKGRSAQQASGWFLRRVHAGGVVRHAGREWTAHHLAARTGQTLAVARAADGSLLAQTLELPTARLVLVPVADMLGGAA